MKLTWVHLNDKNKRLSDESELKEYLQAGWELGRYIDPNVQAESNQKRSETVKKLHANRTTEEDARIREKISQTLKSKSTEEKQEITIKRLNTIATQTPEQKTRRIAKQKETYQKRSEQEKQQTLDKFHQTVNSYSDEQKAEIREHRSRATKRYFANMSDTEKNEFSQHMSEAYAKLTDEQKDARNRKIAQTYRKNCESKYGVTNVMRLPEFVTKASQTVQQRYGVTFACQLPQCKLNGNNSGVNIAFAKLLTERGIEFEREYNLGIYSYDFKVDDTLIELNPFATHNSTWGAFNNPKSKTYHKEKTQYATNNGFKCINVWDWDDWNKIVNSICANPKAIYGRNCVVQELINKKLVDDFLNEYHFQGTCKNQQICLGIFYNDVLIEMMTFGRPRYNNKYEYELLRLCTRADYRVVGGAEKLFNYFINKYNPKSIISYCDNSKFSGRVYTDLGMQWVRTSVSRHWYNPQLDLHITDNLLRSKGFDKLVGESHFHEAYGAGTSNEQLMREHGFVEIYDAGQSTYVLALNNKQTCRN